MTGFSWTPLSDLPEDWRPLTTGELAGLAPIWRQQSERLKGGTALKRFHERLKRAWAIETGIIEGIYTIDRGITETLIERGLDADWMPYASTKGKAPEMIVATLRDQKDTLEGLFDFVSNKRSLSTSYIKEIHAALTRTQNTVTAVDQFNSVSEVPLLRGTWKTQPNNPTRADGELHQYCPPEQVASEMDRLVELHLRHLEAGVVPEVEAAWLHHRFTQIHPFQDGNGRVARTLASLVFLRAGWFPLIIDRDHRERYIDALEKSDAGDMVPLVNLLTQIQRHQFLQALALSDDVLPSVEPIDQVIAAAVSKFKPVVPQSHTVWDRMVYLVEVLESLAKGKLLSLSSKMIFNIGKELGCGVINVFFCENDKIEHDDVYVGCVARLNCIIDLNTYCSKSAIKISFMDTKASVNIIFHSVGNEFVGVFGAGAYFVWGSDESRQESRSQKHLLLSDELFIFVYVEDESAVCARFEKWLDDVLLAGVAEWQRRL